MSAKFSPHKICLKIESLHYWISLLLAIILVPLLKTAHLPFHFDWPGLIYEYWAVLATQSIFVAVIFHLLTGLWHKSKDSIFTQINQHKFHIIPLVVFFLVVRHVSTFREAFVLTVDAMALLEFYKQYRSRNWMNTAASILQPALYLFAGFLLVFAYNDIILSFRFYGSADALFNSIDKWLLHGLTVSTISHSAVSAFPVSFFHYMEIIYFGMFLQLGAGVIFLALSGGKNLALRFVGSILIAYYIALILFCIWPSQGPYYQSNTHVNELPISLQSYTGQKSLLRRSQDIWQHKPIDKISTDYYIAFPCMHIAQPLILIWFLRYWKRLIFILACYDALLVVAIILLQWHYVVDVLAGILLAVLAVILIDNENFLSAIKGMYSLKTQPS